MDFPTLIISSFRGALFAYTSQKGHQTYMG